MPQKERLRVWRGEAKKTAGGLTKKDLMRNSRGKIVSRRKSAAASSKNNLGQWLRKKGDSFHGKFDDKKKPPKAPKPAVDKRLAKPKGRRKSPIKSGEVKNYREISVGNILRGKRKRKPRKK